MSKALTAIAATGLSSLLINLPANAADNSSEVSQFDAVTVNATRISQDAEDVNRTISVVDKENIEEIQPNSVAEAVAYQANVTVSGGAIPGNQKVNIRGLSGDKVLQVIDGARSNTNFSHRPSFFLDPELLKSVEVMKGPSSSLWGSGAIGGVVVQNTINAEDVIQEGNDFGGFIKQGYQDNGEVSTTTGTVATQINQFDVLVSGTYRDSDAMEQGNGLDLYGTKSENTSILAKAGWNIDQQQRLAVQYRYADLEGHPPTVGSAEDQQNTEDNLIDRTVKDKHAAIDYNNKGKSPWLNLDAKLYLNDTQNEETPTFGGTDQSDIETIGLNLINAFEFTTTQVLVGVDGYQDEVKTDRAVNPGSSNRPNPPSKADSDVWGAFTTITHDLNDAIQLEASLRYDSFETESDDLDSSSDESNVSTSAGVRWQATDWMRWTLRYDEAFRAPSSYELYIQGTHFNYGAPGWDNTFVANPDLKPEKAENIELSVDMAFNDLLGKDSLKVKATAFQNDVEDFIYLDVETEASFGPPPACNCVSGTSTHINAQDAEIWGYEIETAYKLGGLTASLSYGQTRGTHETESTAGKTEDHLTSMPADKWVADVNYAFWNHDNALRDTKVGVRVIDAEKQKRVEEGDEAYDGYTLTDFYASWEPSTQIEGLKVDLIVANAFDQNYRQAWSEVSEPGRSARVAAKYSF